MSLYKTTRLILMFLYTTIMVGCFSLSVKDYDLFDKEEPIIPGKDQIEVKYSTSIGQDWATEVALGPEAEYVNVGFRYRPDNSSKIAYANQLLDELDNVINQKKHQQLLDSQDLEMTNLWTDVYSFNLNNTPVSFKWAHEDQPTQQAINILIKRLYWYVSMQMISEARSTTLNTQRNFYSPSDQQCIQNLKNSIYLFPYLTAARLASTTNALEYTEILRNPSIWETK